MPTARDLATDVRRGSSAQVGVMLGGLVIAILVALAHHPVGHGGDASGVLASMRAQATIDQVVHGTLAIAFGLSTVGMFVFAAHLGAARPPVLLGMTAYACAFVLIVLATMLDGFVAPAIVAGCGAHPSASCAAEALTLLRLGALQIEYLTRFAVVALASAVLAWALALLRTPGAPRVAGAAGLGLGALQLVALGMTSTRLQPHSLTVILAAHMLWILVVAILLIRGRGPFANSARPAV